MTVFIVYKFIFQNDNLGSLTLKHIPVNIDEIKSFYVRSEKYHGVNQRIEDISFKWIEEAAIYIRNVIQGYGEGAKISVTIQDSENNIDFDSFYLGLLDLKTYTDNIDSITCRVVNSSAESKVLNNLETDYKLQLPSNLTIQQRDNQYGATYQLVPHTTAQEETLFVQRQYYDTSPAAPGFGMQIFESFRSTGDSEKFNNIVLNSQYYISDATRAEDLLKVIPYVVYKNETENSNLEITINQEIDVYQSFTESGAGLIKLILSGIILNQNGDYVSIEDLIYSTGFNYDASGTVILGSFTVSGTASLSATLTTGQTLLLFWRSEHSAISPTNGSNTVGFKMSSTGSMSIDAIEYKTETTHRSLSVPRAFNWLIDTILTGIAPITGSTTDYLNTELFESGTRYGRTYITGGNELRKPITTGVNGNMTTSIADLWQSLNVPFCLGLGLKTKGSAVELTVDHRSKFYLTELVHDLGEVTEFNGEFDETLIYNALNIDYPSVDNKDFKNGIYEFLTKYGYTTPLNYVDNALENSCPYKVDATSVEELRTNQVTESQESQSDDSTNFLIRCVVDGSTVYSSQGSEFDSISQTGLQNSSQLFNVDMFAPITLRFWAWWILAALRFQENTDKLTIQRNEQNNDVAITIDGVTCDTNDITITKLKALAQLQPYSDAEFDVFEPYNYTFKSPVTTEFLQKFENNRHGVIKFSYRSVDYYGFALKVPALPNKAGEFKLLKLSMRGQSLL